MRKLTFLAAGAAGLYAFARWWRVNRRVGAGFVNRVLNPWLVRRGLLLGSDGSLALLEHVGRNSGTVRRTPIYPISTTDGIRIIIPIGGQSQWARNVLAAGRCRLVQGDRAVEMIDPVLESPTEVRWLPRPVRFAFGWLGFRYLRLRASTTETDAVSAAVESAGIGRREAIAA